MKKFTATIIGLCCIVTLLQAQDIFEDDSVKNYKINEIIIKSPKYNRNIFDIPVTATMLPERMIVTNKIENLTQVSGFIPNLFMPDYGSKLTSPIYIRGVGNRINTPSVGLYVDNIPYFEKSAFNFDLFDIERIEVLRGPQGTLYGRNAMGGLINIITNSPGKERSSSISADYGNYNQIRANITHNQPIGKKLSVLTTLNLSHNDGFYTNLYNNSQVDKTNAYSGRMKVQYNISKKWNASANIQYENSKQGGYPYALYVDSSNTAKDINYDGVSFYNRQMLSSGLNLVYSANNFDLRLLTSHQRIDDEQGIDQDFTPLSLFYVDQMQKQDMLAQEINIQSKDNEQYDWLFGIFAFNQLKNKEVTVNYQADAIKQYNLPFNEYYNTKWYDNSNTGLAIFHESTLKFGGFSATAGIRVDYEVATLDYVYDVFTNGNQANVEKVISEMDFFEILPKVALKYNFSNYLAPYISVAKGYNSGGFNTSFEREEDRSFNPERSINYEAGLKAKWLEQRIYANLALFYIDWTNQQVYQTVPSGTGSMLTNAGKSESKGFEFELKTILAKNLETNLTFGYNEARFVEYIKDNKTDYSGKFLPYVPKFTFNIGANYLVEIDKNWLDLIKFNLNYSGFGKHYWHEDNLSYQSYYGLLNGRISFEHKNITLSAWGKNMLNSDYNSFYFKSIGNSYAQIGKLSTFGFNLKIKF